MRSETGLAVAPMVGSVTDALKKAIALNQNDIDLTLQTLEVPPAERAGIKTKWTALLAGDETIQAELEKNLAFPEEGSTTFLAATAGGTTKYVVLKQWGVPYAEKLYVSHEMVGNALDVGAFVAAVAAVCGPKGESLAAGLTIGLAALKLMDRGNGVVVTRNPIFIGPCVPTPQ